MLTLVITFFFRIFAFDSLTSSLCELESFCCRKFRDVF